MSLPSKVTVPPSAASRRSSSAPPSTCPSPTRRLGRGSRPGRREGDAVDGANRSCAAAAARELASTQVPSPRPAAPRSSARSRRVAGDRVARRASARPRARRGSRIGAPRVRSWQPGGRPPGRRPAGDRRDRRVEVEGQVAGGAEQRLACRGGAGAQRARRPAPARRSAPRTSPPPARRTRPATPRSWVISTRARPRSLGDARASSSTICAWVVTSSAVVGSSQRSSSGIGAERDRDHHPLAHPAGELVRVGVDALAGIADADFVEELDGSFAGRPRGRARCAGDRLGDLIADSVQRVQRRHRVLVDHPDTAAADLVELTPLQLQHVDPAEQSLAAADPQRRAATGPSRRAR